MLFPDYIRHAPVWGWIELVDRLGEVGRRFTRRSVLELRGPRFLGRELDTVCDGVERAPATERQNTDVARNEWIRYLIHRGYIDGSSLYTFDLFCLAFICRGKSYMYYWRSSV